MAVGWRKVLHVTYVQVSHDVSYVQYFTHQLKSWSGEGIEYTGGKRRRIMDPQMPSFLAPVF